MYPVHACTQSRRMFRVNHLTKYCHVSGVLWRIITGSGFHDRIYCTVIELPTTFTNHTRSSSGWTLHWNYPDFQLNWSESQSYVTIDGQSASLSWCQAPILDLRPDFFFVWQLRVCWCGAPSLTRGRVYLLQCTIYLHFTCYYMNVYIIYTRLLSVHAQYSRSYPIFSSFRLWILVVILLHEIFFTHLLCNVCIRGGP
jgi:hypothetical protein